MARIFEFPTHVVVADMEVQTPEGTFRGAASKENRVYASFHVMRFDDPNAVPVKPLADYADAVLRAAAEYELVVYRERVKLEQAVADARAALAKEIGPLPVPPVPAPPETPKALPESATPAAE